MSNSTNNFLLAVQKSLKFVLICIRFGQFLFCFWHVRNKKKVVFLKSLRVTLSKNVFKLMKLTNQIDKQNYNKANLIYL